MIEGWLDTIFSVGKQLLGAVVNPIAGAILFFVGFVQQIIDGLLALASGVIALLPDADPNFSIPEGWLVGYAWVNSFLPLSECLAFAGLIAGALVLHMTWRMAVTVYHLIPKPLAGT